MEEKIMVKKIILSAISLMLAIIITFSTFVVCFSAIGVKGFINSTGGSTNREPKPVVPTLDGTVSVGGLTVKDYSDMQYVTSGDVNITTDGGVLLGYTVGDNEITITTTVGGGICDTVYLDGAAIATRFNESGDMITDVSTVGDNLVTPVLDGDRLSALIVNDGTMSFKYDGERLTEIHFLGELLRKYDYNEDGTLAKSTDADGVEKSFTYENGKLAGENAEGVTAASGSVSVRVGTDVYEYRFGHTYYGVSYVTAVLKNGIKLREYSYVNDSVAAVKLADGTLYSYLFDTDLNCIGMVANGEVYAFIYTPDGNLFTILDSDGNMEALYDVWGFGIDIVASDFSLMNTVVARGAVLAPEVNGILRGGELVLADRGIKATPNGEISALDAKDAQLLYGKNSVYTERGALDIATAIRSTVISEAMFYLESEGYVTASSLSVSSSNETEVGIADIYVLADDAAGYSVKNALAGNKIFAVIEKSESRDAAKAKLDEICNPDTNLFVDYFNLYKPKCADISFEGQFIYLGYLIEYTASEGVITYGVYENDSACYKGYNNIYDYDNSRYVMYGQNTFTLSDWDYTAIIPGVNRETYDVIENYISEALEICSYTTFENVEYFDTGYYDSYVNSAYGDTLDMYVELDPSAMITLSESGGIKVQAVPFFEQTSVRKEFCKAVGTAIVATVVAGVLSVVIPGSGVAFIAIMKTAIITGLTSMVTTTAFAIGTDLFKEHVLKEELNESLNERVHRYVITALNAYSVGVVTGALAGGIRYNKFSKSTDLNLSSKATATDRMNYRLDMLDKQYSGGLIDDSMTARMEYEKYRMMIESTDYSLGAIQKNVIYCTGRDVRIAKRSLKLFGKSVELIKMDGGNANG